MENANMPILVPISPEEFWSRIRTIIREEIGNISNLKGSSAELSFQTPGMTFKPLYKMNEVCSFFQITRPTAYEWIKQGKLKPHKIHSRVFFLHSDIQQLLKEK